MYNEQSTLIQFLLIGRRHQRHTHTPKENGPGLSLFRPSQPRGYTGWRSEFGRYPVASCGLARDCKCEIRGRQRAQTRYSGVKAGARVAPHRGPAEIPGSDSGLLLDKMRDGSQRLWNSQRTSLRHGNDDHQRRPSTTRTKSNGDPFLLRQFQPNSSEHSGEPGDSYPSPGWAGVIGPLR